MQPNKPVVLVVDDDPVNLDILVQTLEQDYFLIIAKNGKRALDLAFSHHPDLDVYKRQGPANKAAYSASCLQTSTHVPPVTRSKSASERHTALFGAPAAG